MKKIRNFKYFILLGLRICVAINLFTYGYGKLTGTMFDNAYVGMLTTPLNEVDNFHLTWYWFQKNKEISIFIGLIQIISAVLLIFNRSKLLGAILVLPILIGILFIDAFVVKSPSLSIRLIFYILVCLSIVYQYRAHFYNMLNDYRNHILHEKISIMTVVYIFLGVVLAFAIEAFLVVIANTGNLIFTK